MRISKWTGLAALAAVLLANVNTAWAIGLIASYTGEMSWGEQAIYSVATTTICTGYGFAASFAFGPGGVLALSAACGFGLLG